MGNREDLLAGARRCLEERGWARTTVRDISAAAGGVSMAAIGYHFGSREALLNEALIGAMDEWGDRIGAAVGATDSAASAAEQYESLWTRMIGLMREDRNLWLANLEALLHAERSPEFREQLVAGQRRGRRGMAAALTHVDEDAVTEDTVRTVGSVQLALLLGVMLQWLNDPDHAPSGPDIVSGLHRIADIT